MNKSKHTTLWKRCSKVEHPYKFASKKGSSRLPELYKQFRNMNLSTKNYSLCVQKVNYQCREKKINLMTLQWIKRSNYGRFI